MTYEPFKDGFGRRLPKMRKWREPISDEAREAVIEHNRTMDEVREWQAANRERIDAAWDALSSPPRTIAEHLATLSAERREELDREWGE